jgi:hypothetical protein
VSQKQISDTTRVLYIKVFSSLSFENETQTLYESKTFSRKTTFCTISLIGCGASGAYAPGPDEEEDYFTTTMGEISRLLRKTLNISRNL